MSGWSSSLLVLILTFGILFSLLYLSEAIPDRPKVVTVIIPNGSSIESSEHNNFEPEMIKVVIGVNNTVRWINHDLIASSVVAGDKTDPDFFNATQSENQNEPPKVFMTPGESFEFTFMKAGTFEYYGGLQPH
jgi:plastocyanin